MKTCPICEMPMMHTRLYGYICRNPEHKPLADEIYFAWLNANMGDLEKFLTGYPERDHDMVRRVIAPELPGWYNPDVD